MPTTKPHTPARIPKARCLVIHGLDLSYANGNPDWTAARRSPLVHFVYSRVCYGDDPADDDGAIFNRNHDECKKWGIPFGAYCFFLFSEDPVAEAQHFVSEASGRYGQLRPVVDVEEGSGTAGSVEQNIARLAAFNSEIKREVGCDPIIYTNPDTWETHFGGSDAFSGHALWVAEYSYVPGDFDLPKGWKSAQIHQYSDEGQVPGFTESVDLDVVLADSLSGLWR